MIRLALITLLAVLCGGLGYFFGYNAGLSKTEPERAAAAAISAEPVSRSRKAEAPKAAPAQRARTQESTLALGERHLSLPLANLKRSDILDTFDQARGAGERRHEAADIMAARGTPVYAVDDGVIKKLFTSKPGGLTIYQYDPSERYAYYYAHLDRYEESIHEGQTVRRGELIGYVGSTGNADPNAPHLHFAILQLGPSREWWHDTTPINPYPYLIAALEAR